MLKRTKSFDSTVFLLKTTFYNNTKMFVKKNNLDPAKEGGNQDQKQKDTEIQKEECILCADS
ncbi:hypothetical protein ACFFJY_02340 [Fictibacillus aquaticus]|uniref:Uncharacterized protein n=1 Tax=Fictibacillus aquaticus TaxID=2021314 RepID=A0A235F951_9BACL|nr:hypothetical protein [Fictibacillus aquaticus]OYD57543.1 hypothetical protein CGZ90_12800 [Fictibacillus aquaticus]